MIEKIAIGLTDLTTYGRIPLGMTFGFRKHKKTSDKAVSDYKMELLVKQGRDQFRKLIEKGLNVPIALL